MLSRQTLIQIGSLIILVVLGAGVMLWIQNNAEALPVADVVDDQLTAQELRQAFVDAGYPTPAEMSPSLTDALLRAYEDGALYTIQSLDDGYARKVSLVSVSGANEVNAEYCGLYSPGLCLIIYELDGATPIIVRNFVGMRGGPVENFTNGHVVLENFIDDENALLLSTNFGDGPGGEQVYATLNLDDGSLREVIKTEFGFDGDGGAVNYTISVEGEDEVTITLLFTQETDFAGNVSITYRSAVISDAAGVLKEMALNIVDDGSPLVLPDPRLSLVMPGSVVFSITEESAIIDGTPGVTSVYAYDAEAEERLTLLQQIP